MRANNIEVVRESEADSASSSSSDEENELEDEDQNQENVSLNETELVSSMILHFESLDESSLDSDNSEALSIILD